MAAREISDQFHYALIPELQKLIDSAMTKLSTNTADTADELGMKTAREQGYIRAVHDVQDLCFRVERKLYGRPDPVAAGDD